MAMTHDQREILNLLDEIEPYTRDEIAHALDIGEERVGIALQALIQTSKVVKDANTKPDGYRRKGSAE